LEKTPFCEERARVARPKKGSEGTNLPESALPYPKEVIRTSLLLWAALEDEPDARTRLCALYVML
jgi:hypothetical protein